IPELHRGGAVHAQHRALPGLRRLRRDRQLHRALGRARHARGHDPDLAGEARGLACHPDLRRAGAAAARTGAGAARAVPRATAQAGHAGGDADGDRRQRVGARAVRRAWVHHHGRVRCLRVGTAGTAPGAGAVNAREQVRAVRETARLIGPSARLLTTTEAHTYAYSVSANFLLASLPFLFLLLWIGHQLFPNLSTQHATLAQLLDAFLPAGQQRLVADATRLASRHTVQVFSLLMLAISSSGVFLPLEVALNSIWGFPRNRSYIGNQVVSLLLVLACGLIALVALLLGSLGVAAAQSVFPAAWTGFINALTLTSLTLFSLPAAILVFFIIYWKLPNGK